MASRKSTYHGHKLRLVEFWYDYDTGIDELDLELVCPDGCSLIHDGRPDDHQPTQCPLAYDIDMVGILEAFGLKNYGFRHGRPGIYLTEQAPQVLGLFLTQGRDEIPFTYSYGYYEDYWTGESDHEIEIAFG